MRPLLRAAFCSLALLAVTAPARAASGQVDIALHDLRIALIDLEPGDGIASGITWDDRTGRGNLYMNEAGFVDSDEMPGLGGMALSGPASAASFEAREHAWRLHASTASGTDAGVNVGAFFDARLFFTLAPHTGMFVRLVADIDAASDYPLSYLRSSASISGYAGLSSFSDSLSSQYPLSRSRQLFGYVHSDADGASGRLEIRGSGAVTIPAVPIPHVPEPSSWALLAAGLGVLGAAGRRRARRARLSR